MYDHGDRLISAEYHDRLVPGFADEGGRGLPEFSHRRRSPIGHVRGQQPEERAHCRELLVLDSRVPRVRLPEGRAALVEPRWAGRLSGFTLPIDALADAVRAGNH